MGDRALRERPAGLPAAGRKRKARPAEAAPPAVVGAAGQLPEVRHAFEWLGGLVREALGDCPSDVLANAVEEIAALMRGAGAGPEAEAARLAQVEELLGPVKAEAAAMLAVVGEKLRAAGGGVGGADGEDDGVPREAMDTELGVAVQFEDTDEEDAAEEGGFREVAEPGDSDSEEGAGAAGTREGDAAGPSAGMGGGSAPAGVEGGALAAGAALEASKIGPNWLRDTVATALGGSGMGGGGQTAADTAEEVLQALLREGNDSFGLESELAELLEFGDPAAVKLLVQNREKVAWCTLLARAPREERGRIQAEMAARPELVTILKELGLGLPSSAGAADDEPSRPDSDRGATNGVAGAGPGSGQPSAARARSRASYRYIPLESHSHRAGSHTMSGGKQVRLPEGSLKTVTKEYEEIYVPPVVKGNGAAGDAEDREMPISELPEWARPAFPGMKALNRVQSRVCESALYSSANLLICAPTGAGKTNIAVLTMLHEVMKHRDEEGNIDRDAFKVVYIAPMRALVSEVVGNLQQRFDPLGLKVVELTGESFLSRRELKEAQIVVATPEKWDIVTRRGGQRAVDETVRLLVIDEVHMLHDERGAVLESLVARTLHSVERRGRQVRIAGLSATLPNYQDVATFLRVEPERGLFFFDGSYRPCPLEQHFVGVTVTKPLQRLKAMDDICYNKVRESAGKSQTIVFVHSRRETVRTAQHLRDRALQEDALHLFLKDGSASQEVIRQEAESVKNRDLKELLRFGFAVHHAGLSKADRVLVEDLFADGHIQVLVSTATLAWGVNLPAHTVIIKGTQVYDPSQGKWAELSPLDVIQMVGRAGRPQFDASGVGILITSYSEVQFYLSALNQQLPIESQMMAKLADSLNAEVVAGVIRDVETGVVWLQSTYMYVRMLNNPELYASSKAALEDDPAQEQACGNLIHSAALLLHKNGLVHYNQRTGQIQATELGGIATKYYVTHSTISQYNRTLQASAREIELCKAFSSSEEFENIIVRQEEKVELAKLLDQVPIPVKEGVEEPSAKVNVLLQAYISQLSLDGFVLHADMVYIVNSGQRLLRCIFEILMLRGWSDAAQRALGLSLAAQRRLWGSQTNFRQFPGLPAPVLQSLERKDVPWDRFYDMSPHEVGECARNPRLGKALHALVHQFPRLELTASIQPVSRSLVNIHCSVQPDFAWNDEVHGRSQHFWLVVEDADSEHVLAKLQFSLQRYQLTSRLRFLFSVPMFEPMPPQYYVHAISDQWLNCKTTLPVSFRHLVLPAKVRPPTELLDLQPLPASAVRSEALTELLLSADVDTLNAVQTQTFPCIFEGDDNAIVCAPEGARPEICGELALMRCFAAHGDGARCVWMSTDSLAAQNAFQSLAPRYGQRLGLSVAILCGDTKKDLKAVRSSNLTVCTPSQLDGLSQRWRERKLLQGLHLVVVDGMHYMGDEVLGPTLECVVSRLRYATHELGSGPRLVALSACLGNGHDVGAWIGAPSKAVFSFHPSARQFPVELQFQVISAPDHAHCVHQMATAAAYAVQQSLGEGLPSLCFAPGQRYSAMLAEEYLAPVVRGEGGAGGGDVLAMESDLPSDPALRRCLSSGVGFVHENMEAGERDTIQGLFAAGKIRALVASLALCRVLPAAQVRSGSVLVLCPGDMEGLNGGGHLSWRQAADVLRTTAFAVPTGGRGLGVARIICHEHSRNHLKAALGALPMLESHLHGDFHPHLNAEVVARTIQSKQDTVDYLTWTFLYRRLTQNPNFYNLRGATHQHISEYLSDLVEGTVEELEAARCLAVEEDVDLVPLNLGMVCAHHGVHYASAELFASLLSAKSKKSAMVHMLANAAEFSALEVYPEEHDEVLRVLRRSPIALKEAVEGVDANAKAAALLQAHLFRLPLGPEMALEKRHVAAQAWRLCLSISDIVASSGWLRPLLEAMELSQCIAQRVWDDQSWLMQLEGMTPSVAQVCEDADIEGVQDVAEAGSDDLAQLLEGSPGAPGVAELQAEAASFPVVGLQFNAEDFSGVAPGAPLQLRAQIQTQQTGGAPGGCAGVAGAAPALWWLVLGDNAANELLAIKQVSRSARAAPKLDFEAPTAPGTYKYNLYLISSYVLGCDQEFEFEVTVSP